ncbi:MAG: ketoacyl-ACP synthase III [Deltaproteobacteria bacterium]|nr:ketoacyl-ACP synthase III [Deltaproteobacteria bacterium]
MPHSIITGTGSYIPTRRVANNDFLNHEFYGPDGKKLIRPNPEIVAKLQEITCIEERRYVTDDLNTSDIAFLAAEKALEGVDRETLDYLIVGHNFGDVRADNPQGDQVPSIAARVKHKLRIKNPYTVAYDVPFGCPGWLHALILADHYIKSGGAKKILVVGAETLSRVSDPHDMDSMIYSDGAGAALVEPTDREVGILSHVTRSDTLEEAYLLWYGPSNHPSAYGNRIFIKMHGHEIYKYALKHVPEVVQRCLDQAGLTLTQVNKVLIHQANQKMDEAILKRLFKLYAIQDIPADIMPMTIGWLGNSSVATLPTLLDLILRGQVENQRLHPADLVVFASVGAGMNINALAYRMP